MVKKILMAIGVLAILGVIVVAGISYYAVDKITSEIDKREPEFRKYVTMTTEEQNNYVAKNIDELQVSMLPIFGASNADIQEAKIMMKEMDNQPEFLQAKINWGRSVVARIIFLNFDDIVKNLNPEVLKQLKADDAAYDVNLFEYRKQLNLYKLNKN